MVKLGKKNLCDQYESTFTNLYYTAALSIYMYTQYSPSHLIEGHSLHGGIKG